VVQQRERSAGVHSPTQAGKGTGYLYGGRVEHHHWDANEGDVDQLVGVHVFLSLFAFTTKLTKEPEGSASFQA
jgi:hypothetical protein